MPFSIRNAALAGLAALTSAASAQTAAVVPDTVEAHLAAGKNAAGGRDNTPDFLRPRHGCLRRAATWRARAGCAGAGRRSEPQGNLPRTEKGIRRRLLDGRAKRLGVAPTLPGPKISSLDRVDFSTSRSLVHQIGSSSGEWLCPGPGEYYRNARSPRLRN